MLRLPRRPTLFPYTTLFRSIGKRPGERLQHDHPGAFAAHVSVGPRVESLAPAVGRHDARLGEIDRQRRRQDRSEEHTSELQSHSDLVCRLLLEKKKTKRTRT